MILDVLDWLMIGVTWILLTLYMLTSPLPGIWGIVLFLAADGTLVYCVARFTYIKATNENDESEEGDA